MKTGNIGLPVMKMLHYLTRHWNALLFLVFIQGYHSTRALESSFLVTDVAHSKPAKQVFTFDYGTGGFSLKPSLAVDGNQYTCAATDTRNSYSEYQESYEYWLIYHNTYAWWQIDLQDMYTVVYVTILAAGDITDSQFLQSFVVQLSNTHQTDSFLSPELCNFYNSPGVASSSLLNITCPARLIGRYVTIKRTGGGFIPESLMLCEVRVFINISSDLLASTSTTTPVNTQRTSRTTIMYPAYEQAQDKPATQIFTYNSFPYVNNFAASRAVDGDPTTCASTDSRKPSTYYKENFAYWQTHFNRFAWWQVDLQDLYTIIYVTILAGDGFADPLFSLNFVVEVSNINHTNSFLSSELCNSYNSPSFAASTLLNITCPAGLVGRYVTIERTSDGLAPEEMTLCEVRVFVMNHPPRIIDATTYSSVSHNPKVSMTTGTMGIIIGVVIGGVILINIFAIIFIVGVRRRNINQPTSNPVNGNNFTPSVYTNASYTSAEPVSPLEPPPAYDELNTSLPPYSNIIYNNISTTR